MKLPSVSLPGLGGLPAKLKGVLRRGKRPSDDDEDDDAIDDDVDAEEPEDDDFDDDEDDDGASPGRRRRLLIAGAAGVALVVAAAGGWFLFAGGDDAAEAPVGASVALEAPSGRPSASGGLSPPPMAAAPGAAAGGAAAGGPMPGAGLVVASVTSASFAGIPEPPPEPPLADRPDPALVEDTSLGPLPKVSGDGRTPAQAYARPFDSRDDRPRIAVVVVGLGLSRAATEAAIRRLPAAVTLAFDAHGPDLALWAAAARRAGHEILVEVPMESNDFPFVDAGPMALTTSVPGGENVRRLEAVLARLATYVGVVATTGSKFTARAESVRPVLLALKRRGLMYVDAVGDAEAAAPAVATEIGLSRAISDLVVDDEPSRAAIGARLERLEEIARERAVAVAVAHPHPVTMARLSAWAATLDDRNLALAPISAVADRQFLP